MDQGKREPESGMAGCGGVGRFSEGAVRRQRQRPLTVRPDIPPGTVPRGMVFHPGEHLGRRSTTASDGCYDEHVIDRFLKHLLATYSNGIPSY